MKLEERSSPPKYAYMHNEPNWGCGEVAFLLTEHIPHGSALNSKIARHLDGTKIARNSMIWCDSCDKALIDPPAGNPRTKNIVEWHEDTQVQD